MSNKKCSYNECPNKAKFNFLEIKLCSRCKNSGYCSVECQKNDWKNGHKKVCFDPSTKIDEFHQFLDEVIENKIGDRSLKFPRHYFISGYGKTYFSSKFGEGDEPFIVAKVDRLNKTVVFSMDSQEIQLHKNKLSSLEKICIENLKSNFLVLYYDIITGFSRVESCKKPPCRINVEDHPGNTLHLE